MPKRSEETFLDYKRRVIDTISPTFCAAKWFNATIWLGNGETTSCHHPPQHKIDPIEIAINPTAIHNTSKKIAQRKAMLSGARPKGCEYCWTFEDMKTNAVSDRVFKTVIYNDEDIETIAKGNPGANVNLKTLEVSFDRICNFACSYCNASFSTKWGQDINEHGPYVNLIHTDGLAFDHNGSTGYNFSDSSKNPFIRAFWKWWPELSQTLQEFRITGGEPLLSAEVWKVIDLIQENKSSKMTFAINSNLGVSDKLIDKLIDKSHHIENFDLYTSCETVGDQAEYIRDGLNYNQFAANIEKVIEKGRFRSLNIMMTINLLCLYGLPKFLDQILIWKNQGGANMPTFTMNMLRFPAFMSPLALPSKMRNQRKEELEDWYNSHQFDPLLLEHERDAIVRLIHYLGEVEKPHRNAAPQDICEKDFKSFFIQYDRRRQKSIATIFPTELTDWMKSVEVSR